MKVRPMLWLGLFLVAISSQLHAQDAFPYEEFGQHLRAAEEVTPLKSNLFGDQVSLYNGATEFDVTDVDLPGNSSLPVRLARRFSITDHRQTSGNLGGFGEWDIEVPYIDGVFPAENGWEVTGANNTGTNDRCSNVTLPYGWIASLNMWEPVLLIWDGNELHIPGEANEELLKNSETKLPDDRSTYPWITKSFYHARCASSTANGYPGQSFVVVSPSGVSYTFNWVVVNARGGIMYGGPNPAGGGSVREVARRSRIFMLATRVEDRFGNWVNYTYNSASQLTKIAANDGREIDIIWSGNSVQSATAGNRTWTYGYAADGTLSSVTRPDGSQWTYGAVSGSLQSVRTPPDNEPNVPTQHCQINPDENSGSFTYDITSPSGAHGTFSFNYQRSYRGYVPFSCNYYNSPNTDYPSAYSFFDNFQLVSKQISGAGLTTQSWSYDYGSGAGGYVTASGSYPGQVETYIPQSTAPYAPPKVVTVTDPSGVTKYSFGVNYGVDEGRLLQTETDSPTGQAIRTVSNTFLPDDQIASQAFPDNAGVSLQPNWKNPMVARLRPEVSRVIVQDGDTYTHQTEAFDVFAQPIRVKRFNNIAGQTAIEEQTTYHNDLVHWVLGLPQQVDNLSTGEVEQLNVYNPNATLQSNARFGETLLSYTYNAAGQLAGFTDGNSHTTSLSNYYRGIPQLINYPDQTSQTAVVDGYGEITSVTDQAGHTTTYSYTPSGWPSQITYPAGDERAWSPKVFTFNFITSAERGIAGGHWRRTVSTGNATDVTYFDAMLRPLLSDTSITGTAGSDITTANSFDWRGLTTFSSYPVSGAPALSAITSGTHKSYDNLSRLTKSQQDSELGLLTTTTAYLAGAATQVTDPNNKVTTSYAQVFDEPGSGAAIKVVAPEGITQTISRDLYGNPLAITQSGLYNGTETDSVTKTLSYDAYHRLCRTTEPESGDTVMDYDGANNLAWSAAGLSITGSGCGQSQVVAAAKTVLSYDPMNRVKTIAPPSGTQSTQYQYDAVGSMKQATSGLTVWNGNYNFRGMLTGETLSVVGQSPWTLGYSHDANGSLAAITYPNGESVAYAPDALGRPTQVGSYASQVSYFPNGAVASFTYGNGTSYLAAQNTRQLLSNFSYGSGSTLNLSEDLLYDNVGNIHQVNDLTGGPRSKTFTYDGLNRLTGAVAAGLWGTESYTYDPLNNLRTRLSGGLTNTYNYDPANRLASITRNGSTLGSYGYDSRGNQTTRNGATLLFDQKDQLSQVTGFDSYAYDAAGRRVVKTPTSGGATTYSFYDHGGQLMYQWSPGISQTTDYIYLGTRMVARNVSLQLVAPGAISFDANPANGSYTVSWGAVSGATAYTVQESANGGAWTTVSSGSGTSAALSGRAGGSYVYQVQGCASAGCGPWTGSATLGVTPALPVVSVPSGTINGNYTVSWTATASTTGYTVQEALNGGAWITIASNTSATSISRPGTTSGSYTYQVSASNAYGSRGWATAAAVTVDTTYGVLPTAPASFTVPASSSNGAATLSWGASTLVTTYAVEQSSNGGSSWSSSYSGSATSTTLSGLADGSYQLHVKACNTYGCSAWVAGSTTLVVTHPPTTAPVVSVPASNTSGSYTVSWSGVAGPVSYTLQEQLNGGAWSTVQANGMTSWSASGHGNGSYGYHAQACNVGGCGPWSAVASTSVLLPPLAPASISIPASSTGSVAVSWAASATATSYTLQHANYGITGWSTIYSGGATSHVQQETSSGAWIYQVLACNASGCSAYKVTSGGTSVTIAAPIAVNGNTYDTYYGIPATHGGYATIGFSIVSGNTWQVYGAWPAGNVVKASGALPAGAVTVQYTWTVIGPPAGDVDSAGILTNTATSPTAVSGNPSSNYTTNNYGPTSGLHGRSYSVRVDFYGSTGANVSSSTCTLTAETEGSP